jgi:DNA-binding response OmpR family regulator
MRNIFEHEGFKVYTVDGGKDCIEELERGFKGIILVDLIMPFMDGWDTLKEIKKRGLTKDVVISVITAKGSPDPDKMKGLEGIIFDYITKPFDIKDLVSNITNMKPSTDERNHIYE